MALALEDDTLIDSRIVKFLWGQTHCLCGFCSEFYHSNTTPGLHFHGMRYFGPAASSCSLAEH